MTTLKERLQQWKGHSKALLEQMNLGVSEAKNQFEKQKTDLGTWVDETKVKVNELLDKGSEKATDLQAKLDELKAETIKKTAETKEALKEQQQKLADKMKEVQKQLDQTLDQSSTKWDLFKEKAGYKLTEFETRFDLFKVQLHLGTKEAQALWEEKKKVLSVELQHIDKKIETASQAAEEKITEFTDDLKKSWNKWKAQF